MGDAAPDPVDRLVGQWAAERPDLTDGLAAMAAFGRLGRLHALAGRAIEAALLYTAGPNLFAIDAAMLEAHKPGFAGGEQSLASRAWAWWAGALDFA